MTIKALHTLQFLYLSEVGLEVCVSYDLAKLRVMVENVTPNEWVIHVDPAGNNHMLAMGEQLLVLSTDKEKIKAGVDLLRRYGKIEQARNPTLAMMNVDHLVGHLFDEVNTPKPNQE